jgi:hypothetical protein
MPLTSRPNGRGALEVAMTCRYCGLETGSGAGHRSQAECIQALSSEIDRAKRLISSFRDGPPHRLGSHHVASEEQPSANH